MVHFAVNQVHFAVNMEGNLGLIGKVLFFFCFFFFVFFFIQSVCLTQGPLNFSVKVI